MGTLPVLLFLISVTVSEDSGSAPRPGAPPSAEARSGASQETVLGEAFDLEKGSPSYTEEHKEDFSAGRLVKMTTLYRSASGAEVAERTLDFSASSTRPDYLLKDSRSGHEEGASVEGGRVRVHYRASRSAPRKEKTLEVPGPFVIDGGFHSFLKENWAALTAGKKVSFNFVVPSRLDYFRFVAYEDPSRGPKDGRQRVIVAVLESRMLRVLVEPIVARYDAGSHRMLEYKGLSNIEDANGKSQKVRLVYKGPGL